MEFIVILFKGNGTSILYINVKSRQTEMSCYKTHHKKSHRVNFAFQHSQHRNISSHNMNLYLHLKIVLLFLGKI